MGDIKRGRITKVNKGITISVLTFCILSISSLSAADLSKVFKSGVATFYDAATLMYISLNPLHSSKTKNKKRVDIKKKSPEEIKLYLKNQGLQLKFNSKPISRKSFAKTLLSRFKLSTSFITKMFQSESSYFRDAKNMGIFFNNQNGDETMTTNELLDSYWRAKRLSR